MRVGACDLHIRCLETNHRTISPQQIDRTPGMTQLNQTIPTALKNTIANTCALATDILLADTPSPKRLAHCAARALARCESDLVVAIALIAAPAVGPQRWRPIVIASSDSDIDLESPAVLSLCAEADSPADDADPFSYVYCRADRVSDFVWLKSEEAARRAAVGLYDYSRACVRLENGPEPRWFIIELAGRTTTWRPSITNQEHTGVSASLAAAAYQFYIQRPAEARDALDSKLTAAQRRVAQLLFTGLSEPEMAIKLGRSAHTIHDHIKAIFHAWDVHSRAEALWRHRHPLDDLTEFANNRATAGRTVL